MGSFANPLLIPSSFAQCVGVCLIAFKTIFGVPEHNHDGDTLTLRTPNGVTNIRLHGIDAPELSEAYGVQSQEYLRTITAGQKLRCEPVGAHISYTRIVARCFLEDGREINQLMVEGGLALDCKRYSHGYYAKFEQSWARKRLIQKGYCHE